MRWDARRARRTSRSNGRRNSVFNPLICELNGLRLEQKHVRGMVVDLVPALTCARVCTSLRVCCVCTSVRVRGC